MPGPVISRNAQDSYVDANTPNKSYSTLTRIFMSSGAQGMLFFPRVWPLGARIISAKLTLYNIGPWAGSVTAVVYRIGNRWSTSSVTWNTKPTAVQTNRVEVTKSNAPNLTPWEFNVTAMLQDVSNGQAWYGFLLNATGAARKSVHSTQSAAVQYRPVLEVTWADEPNKPSQLAPSDGAYTALSKPTLMFDFVDVSGDTTMAAYQVQANSVNDFAAPPFDTGEVASSSPVCDLSLTTFTGVAAGQTAWWRVRVKDGAGLWSQWSEATSFRFAAKPVVTLTNPIVGPPSYVEDSTPPIIWTVTGSAQSAYRVLLEDAVTNRVLWDTGVVTGTGSTVTIPNGMITKPGYPYRIRLHVRDALDRDATPGDTPYVEIVREFTFNSTTATTPVTNLVSTKVAGTPHIRHTWTAATAPDAFNVYRNGALVAQNLAPADVLISGTNYGWTELRVPGRREHTWSVQAVVNSRASGNNPTSTLKVNHKTAWLSDENGTNLVPLFNPSVDPGLSERSEVHYSLDGTPTLVVSSRGKYVGTATGRISAGALEALGFAVSAEDQKNRYLTMRELSRAINFSWADEAIRIFPYEMRLIQVPESNGETAYDVSFSFIEVS